MGLTTSTWLWQLFQADGARRGHNSNEPSQAVQLQKSVDPAAANLRQGNNTLSEPSATTFAVGGPANSSTTLPEPQTSSAQSSVESKGFIVFLEDAPGAGGVQQRALALLNSLGEAGQPSMVFDQLNGFVVNLSNAQAQRLRALGGVKSVEADAAVFLEAPIREVLPEQQAGSQSITPSVLSTYVNATASSGETLPWGVKAVWQGVDISQQGNIASDTYAFVVDSGVINNTGDLNLVSTSSWHKSWITGESAFIDGNGHGSHVAGTIAALANGKGVVGVAPGANVISLKVFDSTGGGASYSSIIDAINHAASIINTNGLNKSKAVVNMSLGGGFSASLDTAVKNAANLGIRFAIAAGNDGRDADNYSPAAAGDHGNVYSVSAVDSSYKMASFSNWDKLTSTDAVDDVDVAAPGVSVLSYNGATGTLNAWNGTSMAAPHVAGLLLMGGVKNGDAATPYITGTADPFAWGMTTTSDAGATSPPATSGEVRWGSTGNDNLVGTTGNDRLAGVTETGADSGRNTLDSLTGSTGADTFLLADSRRGTFYNDGNNKNQGTNDYARIIDFNATEDRVQLRLGTQYLIRNNGADTDLFLGDGNKTFSASDELIAKMQGVNLASGTQTNILGTSAAWTTFV